MATVDIIKNWVDEVRAELAQREYRSGQPDCIVQYNANICFGLELSLAIMYEKLNNVTK